MLFTVYIPCKHVKTPGALRLGQSDAQSDIKGGCKITASYSHLMQRNDIVRKTCIIFNDNKEF